LRLSALPLTATVAFLAIVFASFGFEIALIFDRAFSACRLFTISFTFNFNLKS